MAVILPQADLGWVESILAGELKAGCRTGWMLGARQVADDLAVSGAVAVVRQEEDKCVRWTVSGRAQGQPPG
jgi:hypothetical protein